MLTIRSDIIILDLFIELENCYGDLKGTGRKQRDLLCNKIQTINDVIDKYGKLLYCVYPYDAEMDIEHGKVVAKYAAELMGKPTDGDRISYEEKMKYSVKYTGMFILQVDKSNRKYLLQETKVSGDRTKYKIRKCDMDNFILYSVGIIS